MSMTRDEIVEREWEKKTPRATRLAVDWRGAGNWSQ
jgi:hypothetical protein